MNLITSTKAVEQPPLISSVGSYNDELTVAIAGLALGGAEKVVLDWASRIYPKWRVHIIVLRDHKKEWPVPPFIRVTRLHNKNLLPNLKKLGKSIAKSKNPVCVTHLLKKPERDALSNSGAVVVPVLHNAREGWLEDADQLLGAPYVITVSDACNKDLEKNGWRGQSSVIRHIPSSRRFPVGTREHFRKAWNIPQDALVIGMIGAVKPQKDYRHALRLLKAMHEKRDAYLVIIGGPIGRNGYQAWGEIIKEIQDLNLRSRVALPGFIADAIQCLPAFDVVLNTSHYEGLSIATLEVLINGTPSVASLVGGQGEIEHFGLTLVPKDSPADLWVSCLEKAIDSRVETPSWAKFPTYRLWTLAGLAKPVRYTKKILFVTANLNSGGAQRSLVNLAKAFKRKNQFEIAVCGNSTASYFYQELVRAKVKVFRTTELRDPFEHAEVLVQKIYSDDIGTVCFWNLDPKVKLLLVKTLGFTDIKFIDVSPGQNSFEELENIKEFQKLISFDQQGYYKRLNKLVLKYDGDHPEECKNKTTVIPNGVHANILYKKDYTLHDSPRILVNGRVAPTKFLVEIIEAVKILWKVIPKAELHIFGAAELRHQEYADLVKETAGCEIGKRIFFHGSSFNLDHLSRFDAYVVLGKDQGCPNALLEALAAGLPVVANNNGGTSEQIIHNQTGLLVQSHSPLELSEALQKVLSDRVLAKKLGVNGRKHILHSFSMNKMRSAYNDLFTKNRSSKLTTLKSLKILFKQRILKHFKLTNSPVRRGLLTE